MLAPGWLPPPAVAGFARIEVASPEGQVADWGLSFDDGSRVHIHEYADGRRVVHRDQHDPANGFWSTVSHLLSETWVGPVLGVVLVGVALKALRDA